MSLNNSSHHFFDIWRINTVSTSHTVTPRSECYQDVPGLLQIQGRMTADGKLVIPEETCDKEEPQLINGVDKLISSGDRDLHAR